VGRLTYLIAFVADEHAAHAGDLSIVVAIRRKILFLAGMSSQKRAIRRCDWLENA
jgi:hypothetical protein